MGQKVKIIQLIVVVALLLSACSEQPIGSDVTGKPMRLSDYHGKWLIINYWASWCEACQHELPELNAFYRAHQSKDAAVIGVNYDQLPVAEIKNLAQQYHIRYPQLTNDPAKLLGLHDIPGLPVTFVISPQGKLVQTLLGPQTQAQLEGAINKEAS